MRRLVILLALIALGAIAWEFRVELERKLPPWFFGGSPHQQYARELRRQYLDATAAGSAWLAAADDALRNPPLRRQLFGLEGAFNTDPVVSWRFPVRRGQRIVIDVSSHEKPVFVDLFEADDLDRIASAPLNATRLEFEADEDEELIARVQAGAYPREAFAIAQRAEATLEFPVQDVTPRAVGGLFGDGRDRGGRRHEGIDIFAPRRTPVVAAIDGVVSPQTTNNLGGNVVWIWSIGRGISLYYAHLDEHAVSPGDRVAAGEVIGYVGTSGNARGTPPHLHFGVYARPGGAVDPLPYVCDAPCGERLMQRQPQPRNGRDS